MGKDYIVHKKANQVVPKEFLEAILRQEPSCMSICGCFDDKTFTIERWNKVQEIDGIMNMQEAMKEKDLLLHFGDLAQGQEEDEQPFVLSALETEKEGETEPDLVALLEGDFSGYHKMEQTASDAENVVADCLVPIVNETIEGCDNDTKKLLDLIQASAVLTNSISSSIIGHGSVVLAAPDTAPLIFTKGTAAKKFDWGWASESFEPVVKKEDTPPPAPPTSTKPKTTFSSLMGSTKQPEPVKQTEPPKTEAPKSTDKPPAIACPTNIQDKNHRKKWYKDRGVVNPDRIQATDGKFYSWNKNPLIYPTKGPEYDEWVQAKRGIAKGLENVNKGTTVPPSIASTEPVSQKPKDTAPHHIPDNSAIRQKFKDFMEGKWHEYNHTGMTLFAQDQGGRKIIDPRIKKEMDKKYPSFNELMGYKLQETYGWPRELLLDMATEYPGALVTLLLNYRSALKGTLLALDAKQPAASAPASATPTPEPVSPEAEPTAQPTEKAPAPATTEGTKKRRTFIRPAQAA